VILIYFSYFIDLDFRHAPAVKHSVYLGSSVCLHNDSIVKLVLLGTLQAEEPEATEN